MRKVASIVLLGFILITGFFYFSNDKTSATSPDSSIYTVRGIDVSHHQGQIDWSKVAESEVYFAFIKATEGSDFSDTKFKNNWAESKKANLPRGAYHFFTFCSPGKDQAEHFLQVVPPEAKALPPVIDVEFVGNCKNFKSLDAIRIELKAFISEIEKAWSRRPVLYITSNSFKQILNGNFTDYPIWIRSVFSEPDFEKNDKFYIWQFTDKGKIPGIKVPVDQNVLKAGFSLENLDIPLIKNKLK